LFYFSFRLPATGSILAACRRPNEATDLQKLAVEESAAGQNNNRRVHILQLDVNDAGRDGGQYRNQSISELHLSLQVLLVYK
jgi:hypothetical protein